MRKISRDREWQVISECDINVTDRKTIKIFHSYANGSHYIDVRRYIHFEGRGVVATRTGLCMSVSVWKRISEALPECIRKAEKYIDATKEATMEGNEKLVIDGK